MSMCVMHCQNDNTCAGVSYEQSSGTCKLLSAVSARTARTGWISGGLLWCVNSQWIRIHIRNFGKTAAPSQERERDFYASGKTCLPFHGHKTAIRSYYQWRMSYWCSFVLETKCVLFFSNMLIKYRGSSEQSPNCGAKVLLIIFKE